MYLWICIIMGFASFVIICQQINDYIYNINSDFNGVCLMLCIWSMIVGIREIIKKINDWWQYPNNDKNCYYSNNKPKIIYGNGGNTIYKEKRHHQTANANSIDYINSYYEYYEPKKVDDTAAKKCKRNFLISLDDNKNNKND